MNEHDALYGLSDRTLAEIHRLFALGTPISPPTRVLGGLLHQMYRLHTARGDFAVKCLSPTIMQYPNVRDNFRRSEQIAAAVARAGVPAITALSAPTSGNESGEVLHDIGHDTILIYPWLDAQTTQSAQSSFSPISAGAHRTGKIGRLLGRIHALRLILPDFQPPSQMPVDSVDADHPSNDFDREVDEWKLLVDEGERYGVPNVNTVRSLLPTINNWTRAAHTARQSLLALNQTDNPHDAWVISHGDLDQKNVLWSGSGTTGTAGTADETPYLLDWESAGYVQPAIEAVGTALDWSGQVVGRLDEEAFHAFLDAYRQEKPLSAQEVRYGLQTYCANWTGWLKFNLQRSAGVGASEPEEQALGRKEVANTLALLLSANETVPKLGGLWQRRVTENGRAVHLPSTHKRTMTVAL